MFQLVNHHSKELTLLALQVAGCTEEIRRTSRAGRQAAAKTGGRSENSSPTNEHPGFRSRIRVILDRARNVDLPICYRTAL